MQNQHSQFIRELGEKLKIGQYPFWYWLQQNGVRADLQDLKMGTNYIYARIGHTLQIVKLAEPINLASLDTVGAHIRSSFPTGLEWHAIDEYIRPNEISDTRALYKVPNPLENVMERKAKEFTLLEGFRRSTPRTGAYRNVGNVIVRQAGLRRFPRYINNGPATARGYRGNLREKIRNIYRLEGKEAAKNAAASALEEYSLFGSSFPSFSSSSSSSSSAAPSNASGAGTGSGSGNSSTGTKGGTRRIKRRSTRRNCRKSRKT